MSAQVQGSAPQRPWNAAIIGGLVAGTVDIGSACIINSLSPVVILQAIASGILGTASFGGGAASAALGLVLQLSMSVIIAAIYCFAVGRLKMLRRAWPAGGIIAGFVIFGVMNYVVVPLSAVGRVPHFTPATFAGNLVALVLFGLIVAFFARDADPPFAGPPAAVS